MNWLNNEELFIIYATSNTEDDPCYDYVSTNKSYNSFTFRKAPFPLVFPSPDGPERTSPPRFSIQRLRKWEPVLDDWLIVTAAHSIDVASVTKSAEPIDPQNPIANEYLITDLVDARKATVPQNFEQTRDSTLIGEVLDLSSRTKVPQPSRRLEEITESPSPLPALYLLTHEGILAAWWVVWDRSLEAQTTYPSLACNDPTATTSVASAPPSALPAASPFGQATSNQGSAFAAPKLTSAFGNPPSSASSPAFGKPAFGSASTPGNGGGFGFGKPSTPGATPAGSATSGATFGAPGFGNKPAFGSPGLGGKPAFGAPSQIGGQSSPAFGVASQAAPKSNPFATAGSSAPANPFAAASQQSNPFAAAAANMKGGSKEGSSLSPFGSFASNKDGKSGFGNLQSKPGSFGSTITVDSKASGLGSTLASSSFGNPPSTQSGSIFGQKATSSFQSFTSTQSGSTDLGDRGREEATPTPQHPPALKQVTGISNGKFELGSTFKPDGSAKDDLPKPATSSGGSLFGSGFTSALGGLGSSPQAPATPEKPSENKSTIFPSTTPATAPRPLGGLFSNNRSESTTPKPAPPKQPVIPEEAPLPPPWKPAKTSKADDEIPPLAGSPPVKIEAPSSSADELPSSPLDDEEDGDLSNGEDEEEQESEQEGEEYSDEEEQSSEDEQSGEGEGPEQSSSPVEPVHHAQEPQSFRPQNFPAAPTPQQTAFRPQPPVHSSSTPLFGGTRRDPISSLQPPVKPPTPQPVFSDLVDDEDERIRQELDSEIEPSRTLAPFIARQEYSAPEAIRTKTGHAAQIEIVYRDINSMIDTLGLNSRSLKAFIEWNERSERYGEIDRSALEEVQDQGEDGPWFEKWALSELDELKRIEDDIERDLADGAIKRVTDKLHACRDTISDNAKLLSSVNNERRRIANAKDPEKLESLRKASLPKELADQQRALRREYAHLLTSLGKAEDELLLMRSRLVSHNAHNGHMGAVPSVEAIKNTITRLTGCALDRNNRIALLEARLLKARAAAASAPTPAPAPGSRPASSSSTALPRRPASSSSTAAPTTVTTTPRRTRPFAPANGASEAGTPFATPPTHASARARMSMSLQELNAVALTPEQPGATPSRSIGLFYGGRRGRDQGQAQNGETTTAREVSLSEVADWIDEELEELQEKGERRKEMGRKVVGAVRGRGVRRVEVK